MKKLLRIVAVAVMGLSLTTGVAAANSGSIGTTGPNSNNQVTLSDTHNRSVANNNNVGVANSNPQVSSSGNATSATNTTGGGAVTGVARNDSLTRATVRMDNSSAMPTPSASANHTATISGPTGPSSNNQVDITSTSNTVVTNNNTVTVTNTNSQNASSGDAVVTNNTTGGTAQSGGSENISTNEFVIEFTN